MARPVFLSNGNLMVGLNEQGLVNDFYYPYVGEENLSNARSQPHMIGVWVDGKFSWLNDGSWQLDVDFEEDALVSDIKATNDKLGVKLELNDFVDCDFAAFCRRISVSNLADKDREIKIFLHQVFQISHQGRADTVLFVPDGNYLYDYKGRCALLISAVNQRKEPFKHYSTGNYGIEGKQGTYKDAEDGELEGNLVEHGSVDSVLGYSLKIAAGASDTLDYWVVAATSQLEAQGIHEVILRQGLHARLDATRQHWRQWLQIAQPKVEAIDEGYRPMFKKSLLLIKSHIDNHGGIIASGDSSIYNYGRDYYSYVWPRDGALTFLTLMRVGYQDEAKRFFEFCLDTINPGGYMMHKYQPDRSIGSTWHPLMHKHHPELAIQEDETALVVYALCYYLDKFGDDDFVNRAFDRLIKPAANFMTHFIDSQTNLPHASYDLWEEKFGTHTFTVTVTRAALLAASDLAYKLGNSESARTWEYTAGHIGVAMGSLYDEQLGYYVKSQYLDNDGRISQDKTLDSSTMFGFLEFDPSHLQTQQYQKTAKSVMEKLSDTSPSGGTVRYEHDSYFLEKNQYLGNPWLICTLWLARHITTQGDKKRAKELVDWCIDTALASGVLSEQVDPDTKKQVGVSPLIWSHAELIETLLEIAEIRD
jgi:GH15 family glucan-1,4-alpha-glucosidase